MKACKVIPNYRYFESQEPDEQVVFIIRRHWSILAIPYLIGALVALVALFAGVLIQTYGQNYLGEAGETIFVCVMSLIFLFDILYVFTAWLIRYLSVIILTNEHLVKIKQLALFSRKVSELDLDCIEDASSEQKGFIPTMIHFGTVLIQTASELPNFAFGGVEDPNGVQQKIMEIKEQYMKTNHNNTGVAQNQIQNPQNPNPEVSSQNQAAQNQSNIPPSNQATENQENSSEPKQPQGI